MRQFEVSMLDDLPLDSSSKVLIVGGYDGVDALNIWKAYGCDVVAIEPVPEFYDICHERFRGKPIRLLPHALAEHSGMVEIRVKGNMSGMFADGPIVAARGLTLGDFLNLVGWDRIDHFKLNCEGMEYEILDYIIANELMPLIKTLHVQFHPILADSNARYEAIAVGLSKTHDLDFRDPWVWESWTLKP